MIGQLAALVLPLLQAGEPNAEADGVGTPPQTTRAWDLISIARNESALKSERIRSKLRNDLESVSLQTTRRPIITAVVDRLALEGPDLLPPLLDVIGGLTDGRTQQRMGEISVEILVKLLQQSPESSGEVYSALSSTLQSGSYTAKLTALHALQNLDDERVLALAEPFLNHAQPDFAERAIRAVGNQSSPRAAVLLRPLLKNSVHLPLVVTALAELRDAASIKEISAFLGATTADSLQKAAVTFLQQVGTPAELPQLREVLFSLKKDTYFGMIQLATLDAVTAIGLRHDETSAEDLLIDVWKNGSTTRLRDRARWKLGFFENKEAYQELEREFRDTLRDRNRKTDPTVYLSLAEVQIQFRVWGEAVESLGKADRYDEQKVLTQKIERLRAVAYCGDGKFDRAERSLKKVPHRVDLLAEYPILETMANDPDYAGLFEESP